MTVRSGGFDNEVVVVVVELGELGPCDPCVRGERDGRKRELLGEREFALTPRKVYFLLSGFEPAEVEEEEPEVEEEGESSSALSCEKVSLIDGWFCALCCLGLGGVSEEMGLGGRSGLCVGGW